MNIIFFAIHVRGADSIGRELIEWVRILRRQGNSVRVFVERIGPGTPEDIRALTIVHSEHSLRSSSDWETVCAADLIVCDYPAFYGLADLLRIIKQSRMLFIYHGVTPPSLWPNPEGRLYLEQSRQRAALVHFADGAVTHSEYTRQELHHLTGYPLARISVLPCIVQTPPAKELNVEPHTSPLILSVGRLVANKRPELLVEALALVRLRYPDTRLVLAGEARGPSHAPVLAHIRSRMAALNLNDAVLCTGVVDDTLLEHLYAQASVLVTASAHEGFCIPVIEAMARGVPVVANSAAALPQTVGDAGILVPDGDVQALANAILAILDDADTRALLITRGYERARNFTPTAIEPALLRLVQALPLHRYARASLPRLSQVTEIAGLDAAAEIGNTLPQPAGRIPIISNIAIRLRGWITSDIERKLDALLQRQVSYNRQTSHALQAMDQMSATISEQLAHISHPSTD